MSARTNRTRMLAAAALAVATLTLTACNNGEGTRDEGASTASASTSSPMAAGAPSPETSEGTSTGAAEAGSAASAHSAGSASKASTGASGSTGSHGSKSVPVPASTSCSSTSTRTTATEVSRPLNHLLLTVTNTGSKNCDLIGYPVVRFSEAQSVPPAIEASKPQAVVTLAPGESGYASVLLSAADGSGSHGYTAKSLAVYFDKSASVARPSLPAKGVYIDSSLSVSYWQSDMADALAW
ncbi:MULTISPECIES: DUF4232 domain-containing protein [unclassified Streptomyces]|uniref:DUF4232 domain-containing protein n=1 Tax=unclassified Streptomyces TaxID=2593676 RepID=UPI00081E326A|nr:MULTISPECIES: DUF4232 domain-containing protein [unclassified Streptomyces]MYZ39491.1 DUF4232 domain-containing protein [Streptomyces sp. SID4917]SCG03990.1 Protein of unknown function [Streptomyces sp. MnatMP-M17]